MSSSARLGRSWVASPLGLSRGSVAVLFFLSGLTGASWISRIPEVQVKLGLQNGALGLALLSATVGAVLAMPIAGMGIAHWGSQRVSRIAVLATCCALLLPALAATPAALVLGLFAFGAAGGSLGVAMNAQAVLVEQRSQRPIMASFHAAFSGGGLCGAGLGSLLAGMGARPSLHLASMSLLALTAVACVWRFLPQDEARPVEKSGFALRLPNRTLVALGLVSLCAMIGEGAVADWSGVYLRSELHATAGLAASGFTAFSFAMAGTRTIGDRLMARLGPVRLLRVSGAMTVLGLVLTLTSHSAVGALLGFACIGAGFATVVPTVFSAAGRVPGLSAGYALATVTTLGYAGFLAGPPTIGFASEVFGLRGALSVLILTSALIAILARSVAPKSEAGNA